MSPPTPNTAESLRGQTLHIPNLQPAFTTWKQGINPAHARVRQAVDARLAGLIGDETALAKVKGADIGLFAAGWFPDADYDVLETAAFYCVWLFLWDDAIDGSGSDELEAGEYCRRSVAFVRQSLGIDEPGMMMAEQEAPTEVCASFADVGRRVGGYCDGGGRKVLLGHLREYMEGCVTEYEWRRSGRVPSVEEFYSWRLKTSSVDVMLDLCRILNRIKLPDDILESEALTTMGVCVNKLLILINELFSLKKELKDGAFGNLIPITMRASNLDLEAAAQSTVQNIYDCIRDFDNNASSIRTTLATERHGGVVDHLEQLIQAYQAIATTVLHFSIVSPRYGLLKDQQEDGSFRVTL